MKKFAVSFLAAFVVLGAAAGAYLYSVYHAAHAESGASAAGPQQNTASQSRPSSSSAPQSSAAPPSSAASSEGAVPAAWNDGGIFSAYYVKAYQKLLSMTEEEKVGQMILARCPETDAAQVAAQYHLGGYVLFERDFKGRTAAQVVSDIRSYQTAASIPLLVAVDEEGGTVVRISGNPKLAAKKFRSPQQIYRQGGLSAIRADTLAKAALLKKLGVNLNLAPVADVSTSPADYIYERTLGRPAAQTREYVAAVVKAMRESGLSSTLKHFPGYGDNKNTHTGISVDKRSYASFEKSDFLPFESGIAAGAESILVAHTVVQCMDQGVPASLSPAVHSISRDRLHFTGVVMTDDLSMDAVRDYTQGADPSVKAALAGNDLLVMTDYARGFGSLLAAVRAGTVPQKTVDRAVFRILAWKYAEGILQ